MPGIGLSPDKMLLGRASAYNDAQRNRIGANFHQLPVDQPKLPVNSDKMDGPMVRGGVREPVLSRAFQYWKNVDAEVGGRIEAKVRAGAAPRHAEGMGEG